jgi:hypothetical protein
LALVAAHEILTSAGQDDGEIGDDQKTKTSAATGDTPGSGRRLETHQDRDGDREWKATPPTTGMDWEGGGVGDDTVTRSRRQRSDGARCSAARSRPIWVERWVDPVHSSGQSKLALLAQKRIEADPCDPMAPK